MKKSRLAILLLLILLTLIPVVSAQEPTAEPPTVVEAGETVVVQPTVVEVPQEQVFNPMWAVVIIAVFATIVIGLLTYSKVTGDTKWSKMVEFAGGLLPSEVSGKWIVPGLEKADQILGAANEAVDEALIIFKGESAGDILDEVVKRLPPGVTLEDLYKVIQDKNIPY